MSSKMAPGGVVGTMESSGSTNDERNGGRGEPEGFDRFFRSLFPKAVAVARRVTNDPGTAEDAALEAFVRAHLRWAKIGGEPWREAWILRVTVNEAIRRLQRRGLEPPTTPTADLADEVVLRETLRAALRSLPRRQAEVIALRYLVGLSEAEIAAALDISRGTVKTHLRRGLSGLRGSVGHNLEEAHVARPT